MTLGQRRVQRIAVLLIVLFLSAACMTTAAARNAIELSDRQVEKIVRLSYPYVALYNVNNKFALDDSSPMYAGGWNEIIALTALADHTMQSIARPNNDTLYLAAMVDVRQEPVILEFPAFGSKYVSLMVTAYDHYVNVPLSTTQGDFGKPTRILFYSERTPGYRGDPVRGVDQVMEVSGDFVSAVIRVMPHANEPARLESNRTAMREVGLLTLGNYLDQDAGEVEFVPWQTTPGVENDLDIRRGQAEFPAFGRTDFDIFENNLLEVMQFVFNHTSFDPKDDHDRALLAVYKDLGGEPGKAFDPGAVAQIDGQQFRIVAQTVAQSALAMLSDPNVGELLTRIFLPKGEMDQALLVDLSVIGPTGQPAHQALYPPITAADGKPVRRQSVSDSTGPLLRDSSWFHPKRLLPPGTPSSSFASYVF